MKRFYLLRNIASWATLLALSAFVLASSSSIASTSKPVPDKEQIARAEALYSANCSSCHGSNGTGGTYHSPKSKTGVVPGFANRPEITAAYIDLVLRNGRMDPIGDPFDNRHRRTPYPEYDREALVLWMTQRFDLDYNIPQDVHTDEALVFRGQEVYNNNCSHCHGNTGAGGTAGSQAYTPKISGLDPIEVVEGIRVGPFDMPAFNEYAISHEDANAVASYLSYVHEEETKHGLPLLGLTELNPVYAAISVAVLALAGLLSLMYLGSHPIIAKQPKEEEEGE